MYISYFFFNDTATTEMYALSLHDARPIYFVGVSWQKESREGFRTRFIWSRMKIFKLEKLGENHESRIKRYIA